MSDIAAAHLEKPLSVGNALLDSQHEEIVRRIVALYDAIQSGDIELFKKDVSEFVIIVSRHYDDEEIIFCKTEYDRKVEHKVEHKVLRHMAGHIRKCIDGSGDIVYLRLSFHYLAQALYEHNVNLDQSYKKYIRD